MTSLDRRARLERDGFKRLTTAAVALPYQLWHVTLLIEYDRKFRLTEETCLRLINEGVTDQRQLAQLMGLENDEAFRQVLIDLLRGLYLRYSGEALQLTPLGQQAATSLKARMQRRFNDALVLYDAYSDELNWYGDEKLLSADTVTAGRLHKLPEASLLTSDGLAGRYGQFQRLVIRDGIPNDPSSDRKKDLLQIEPIWWEPVYKRADMEIFHSDQPPHFDWLLLQNDLELLPETKTFKRLEAEDVRIIPKLDAPADRSV